MSGSASDGFVPLSLLLFCVGWGGGGGGMGPFEIVFQSTSNRLQRKKR